MVDIYVLMEEAEGVRTRCWRFSGKAKGKWLLPPDGSQALLTSGRFHVALLISKALAKQTISSSHHGYCGLRLVRTIQHKHGHLLDIIVYFLHPGSRHESRQHGI